MAEVICFTQTENVHSKGKTHTTGGRDAASSNSDGRLDIKHSITGKTGNGINPEQLFAGGRSACFIGAMRIGAAKMKSSIWLSNLNKIDPNGLRQIIWRSAHGVTIRKNIIGNKFMSVTLQKRSHQINPVRVLLLFATLLYFN